MCQINVSLITSVHTVSNMCPRHALGRVELPLPLSQEKEGKVYALGVYQPLFHVLCLPRSYSFLLLAQSVACSSLLGKWMHLGDGTFQACVCLQYTGKNILPHHPS